MAVFPLVHPRSVLITGCSTGIGAATAAVLRERGWQVLPTARREADLERLIADGFKPIALDVSDSGSVHAAAEAARARCGGRLGAVVNNAGFGQPGALEDLSRDVLRRQFEVNVFGLQELTNRLIPGFREQGYGRIVHVGSVLGRVCMPFNACYSASKFAVEALADGLRIELHGSGIAVSLIEPGPIASQFRGTAVARAKDGIDLERSAFGAFYKAALAAGDGGPRTAGQFELPPESVAAKITHALESRRPRRRYGVTRVAVAVGLARRFFPDALLDAVMIRACEEHRGRLPT